MSLEGPQSLMTREPILTPVIPDNAPFSIEQRAWLSGFLAGLVSLDQAAPVPLSALENTALIAPAGPKRPARRWR